jgi:hypothetical protein
LNNKVLLVKGIMEKTYLLLIELAVGVEMDSFNGCGCAGEEERKNDCETPPQKK